MCIVSVTSSTLEIAFVLGANYSNSPSGREVFPLKIIHTCGMSTADINIQSMTVTSASFSFMPYCRRASKQTPQVSKIAGNFTDRRI
jgi:hypothetical protein